MTNKLQEKIENKLKEKKQVTNITLIAVFVIGLVSSVFVIELSNNDNKGVQPKQYSYNADQLCENMGYDGAYGYASNQNVVDCMAWSGNRSDSKVNLNLVWKYVGENPKKFDNNYDVEWE